MKTNKTANEMANIKNASEVLREKLHNNRQKLQLIAHEIVEKNQELGKLREEIEELGKMYSNSLLKTDTNL